MKEEREKRAVRAWDVIRHGESVQHAAGSVISEELLAATPVFLERHASFEIYKPDRSNVSEKLQSPLFPIFLRRKLQI